LLDIQIICLVDDFFNSINYRGEDGGGFNLIANNNHLKKLTTLNAWNRNDKVYLVKVSCDTICGAKTKPSEGGDSFHICGNSKGGSSEIEECKNGEHKKRGSAIDLPLDGSPAYTIKIATTSKSKVHIWNAPLLLVTSLPREMRGWTYERVLLNLSFPARTWKLLLEGYPGYEVMCRRYAAKFGGDSRLHVDIPIPSPTAGAGGPYNPMDFEDHPEGAGEFKADDVQDAPREEQPPLLGGDTNPSASVRHPEEPRSMMHEEVHDPLDGSVVSGSGSEAALSESIPYFSASKRMERRKGGGNARAIRATNPYETDDYSVLTQVTGDSTAIAKLQKQVNEISGRLATLRTVLSERAASVNESFSGAAIEMEYIQSELERVEELAESAAKVAECANDIADTALSAAQRPPPPVNASIDTIALSRNMLNDSEFEDRVVSKLIRKLLREETVVTNSQLEEKLAPLRRQAPDDSSPSPSPQEMTGLNNRISALEDQMFKVDGLVPTVVKQVKGMEDQRAANAVVRGRKVFRNVQTVEAFVKQLGDDSIYRLAPDMVSLIMLAPEPVDNIADLVSNEAAVIKANFSSQLEATVSLSFGLTYPKDMIEKTTDTSTRGTMTSLVKWGSGYSNVGKFKGVENEGTRGTLLDQLLSTREAIEQSINFDYPIDSHPVVNAILTEQLMAAYRQAVSFIGAFVPLYERVKRGGLTPEDSWDRVLQFAKHVFDDAKTKRVASKDRRSSAGKMWSAFQATDMLKEYERLHWIHHPGVSSLLSFTAMQSSGKVVEALTKRVTTLEALKKSYEEALKDFKKKNKDLKF